MVDYFIFWKIIELILKKLYIPNKIVFILFEVPKDTGIPHFVSLINPNINNKRISITGWYS